MTSCNHRNLVLLPEKKERLRCRHCHLTITAEELEDGCCPECFETTGHRRYDFDPVADESADTVCYRCEDCGIPVPCGTDSDSIKPK